MRKAFAVTVLSAPILLSLESCRSGSFSSERAPAQETKSSAPATPVERAPDRLPEFSVKDSRGREISAATVRGKVAPIDFWATWCPPCRKEIPHFNELYAKYRDRGLVIVGLALDENEAHVRTFVRGLPIDYPVTLASREVQELFGGIEGFPTAFLVDRDGKVIKKYLGLTYPDEFERDVAALINSGELH